MPVMSMTGFGRFAAERGGRRLTLELKSVNHRFLDLSFRLPRSFNEFEDLLRKGIQQRLSRGHVDVFLKYENNADDAREVQVNDGLIRAYLEAFKAVSKRHGVKNDVRMRDLLAHGDVFQSAVAQEDSAALKTLLQEAMAGALDAMVLARTEEGERLKTDLLGKLDAMEALRLVILERAPHVVEEYRAKLAARIAELMEAGTIDENRLGAEVAMYAERCAIDEELVRLKSHMDQLRATFAQEGAIGRQLDFIVQEMNREVNTICSKSQDKTITTNGLALKGEVEKIREQVQNIE